MIYAVFALIGMFVVARLLFSVLFPVTSMRIRLALMVRSLARLAEHQAHRVERAYDAQSRSRS